jgi:CheY-like chemotaxis protein/anti-sigma regulatory factor (Ser/Thr protein kinase)
MDPPRFRALVVDDDPDVRFLLGRALRDSGRVDVVAEAVNGREAVTAAAEHEPDLVLLDLNMPVVDGLTALPQILAVCPPTTVVAAMSALVSNEAATEALEQGAAAFLTKEAGYTRLVTDVLQLMAQGFPAGGPDERQARWDLPPELNSGARARRQLRRLLGTWDLPELLDTTELLATELINNAVVHARSHVTVSVRQRPDCLRVEVTDVGAGVPNRPNTDLTDTHGRGLMLVEAMSAAWGAMVNGDAKTVWFEVSTN